MNKNDIAVRAYTSKKIREYRKLMGWTQKDLGDRVGVKFNTISGWENGVSEPLQDQLFTMASLFKISINDLFPPTVVSHTLNDAEKDLITDFRKLNPAGQTAAAAAVKGFTQMQQYKNDDSPLYVVDKYKFFPTAVAPILLSTLATLLVAYQANTKRTKRKEVMHKEIMDKIELSFFNMNTS